MYYVADGKRVYTLKVNPIEPENQPHRRTHSLGAPGPLLARRQVQQTQSDPQEAIWHSPYPTTGRLINQQFTRFWSCIALHICLFDWMDDEFDDFDDEQLEGLMRAVAEAEKQIAVDSPPKKPHLVQKTLWNLPAAAADPIRKPRAPPQNHHKPSMGNPFAQAPVVAPIISGHEVDLDAVKSWVYPTNYSERAYQFNIVQACISRNTLVALPTGLGKTFIAAVLMYNFHRWFPKGKIVFMAPTKPLVAQQIDACFNIVGIPQEATCEMTGTTAAEIRKAKWRAKNVFFLTPQIMQNDLKAAICPASDVVLVVIDEAHRASGNYAYCNVIKSLVCARSVFRVLALSATPGSDTKSVQAVVDNLLIQKVEIRTEESMDIQPYIFTRSIQEIVVAPSSLMIEISKLFSSCIEPSLKKLVQCKAFHSTDAANINYYSLILSRDRYRQQNPNPGSRRAAEAEFAVSITLCRILGLLMSHGIRSFANSLQKYVEEGRASTQKLSFARERFINDTKVDTLLQRMHNAMGQPLFSSHPKIDRLVGLVVQHFTNGDGENDVAETRCMIFSQYRESVEEIVNSLQAHDPLIRVMSFVGQADSKTGAGKGLKQKDQIKVLSEFQNGGYNVLVATSIGEEGLDIGEVDLIICFDSQGSPIRMLQRMGRTGRKRKGQIALLLCKGCVFLLRQRGRVISPSSIKVHECTKNYHRRQ